MIYGFSAEKNQQLISERNISFDEIISALDNGNLLDVLELPNQEKYPQQRIYVVDIISADVSCEASSKYFKKDTRVNIRISSNDLQWLKQKAAYKGLPYQTFIASVLHEYAAGHFQEK